MTRESLLQFLGLYYLFAILAIDVVSAGTAIFTQLTFREFGRQSTAKRLINDGLILTASAWTLFLLGVLPRPISPLEEGDRVVCLLFGVSLKVIGQSMQAIGWYRFWVAIRASFDPVESQPGAIYRWFHWLADPVLRHELAGVKADLLQESARRESQERELWERNEQIDRLERERDVLAERANQLMAEGEDLKRQLREMPA